MLRAGNRAQNRARRARSKQLPTDVNNTQTMDSIRHAGNASKRTLPAFDPDWGLFLDIDGTLVDFAARPDGVCVDPALKSILRLVLEATGGAVALISGRSIVDIDRILAPLQLPVAGQHGVERRNAAGDICVYAMPTARLRSVAKTLERLAAQSPALLFENKGATLALHYRRVPGLAPYLIEIMHGLLASLGGGFELLAGNMVFEIKPGGANKGTAIAEFMQERPFRGRVPVFIGDDLTDEYGFKLVNSLGGHSVKVGAGVTAARWRLAGPNAVRAWLGAFATRPSPVHGPKTA